MGKEFSAVRETPLNCAPGRGLGFNKVFTLNESFAILKLERDFEIIYPIPVDLAENEFYNKNLEVNKLLTEEQKKEALQHLARQDRIMRRLKGKPPLPGEQEATDAEVADFLAGIVETTPAKPKGLFGQQISPPLTK